MLDNASIIRFGKDWLSLPMGRGTHAIAPTFARLPGRRHLWARLSALWRNGDALVMWGLTAMPPWGRSIPR